MSLKLHTSCKSLLRRSLIERITGFLFWPLCSASEIYQKFSNEIHISCSCNSITVGGVSWRNNSAKLMAKKDGKLHIV